MTLRLIHAFRGGVFALGIAAALGCGDDARHDARGARPAAPETPTSAPMTSATLLYDSEGNLLESDEVLGGLQLPRGLELRFELERRHIYQANVPREKLLEYLGPRLVTGRVDASDSQVVYRAARPASLSADDPRRMDVTVRSQGSRQSYFEVMLLPVVTGEPPSAMAQEEALRRMYRSLE